MEYQLENIIIRPVTDDDVTEVARAWELDQKEISIQDATEVIEWIKSNHKQNQKNKVAHLCFGVFERTNNKIIGWCGLDGRSGNAVNMFYLISQQHRRLGYGTLCAEKILEYGFKTLELERIDGECAKTNIASQRILEKIGMKKRSGLQDGSHHYFLTYVDYQEMIDRK